MTKTFATQAIAAVFAAVATLATVTGVDGIARNEAANAQALATAQSDAQVASVQRVTIVARRVNA